MNMYQYLRVAFQEWCERVKKKLAPSINVN